jgi:hypothetical protein
MGKTGLERIFDSQLAIENWHLGVPVLEIH